MSDNDLSPAAKTTKQFPCKNCGATLVFQPGTTALKCGYCGVLNEIAADTTAIEELDFQAQLAALAGAQPTADEIIVPCGQCGAESKLPEGQAAGKCPFCGASVVATMASKKQIKPKSLLPFAIERQRAQQQFGGWLGSLWLAPNGLKRYAEAGSLNGIYLPAWTFDAQSVTPYTGQRGDYYYVTQTYSTIENGRSVTRTRQVRKTRWRSAWGTVHNSFDDVLVLADKALPGDLRDKLRDWDLPALVPYQDAFLSGFVAETYQVELAEGFGHAQQIMVSVIQSTIRQDIGGDEQHIESMHPQFSNITFKHILVPVWLSA
ncbi:MAG TPA: hypothetical protein VGB55_05030, partial [Tepidisphaeraceae bacterium]